MVEWHSTICTCQSLANGVLRWKRVQIPTASQQMSQHRIANAVDKGCCKTWSRSTSAIGCGWLLMYRLSWSFLASILLLPMERLLAVLGKLLAPTIAQARWEVDKTCGDGVKAYQQVWWTLIIKAHKKGSSIYVCINTVTLIKSKSCI